ncbi:dihydroflavonal-4-reductase protein [Gigaspora margarita]|uniref:Dihydroflavonal-4-reductase protein n=1 Tax=Gigaspora margarita TaxID=4874 RepID=A0A8H4APY1_GIGMA|nr:dihydroflavonal-4-reductase protein [Gigaspora margarita]
MAVSVANYQGEQSVPKLNSLGYDDESVSLAKCLPSHPQKPSRLPIFEAAVTQQNDVGNSQRNALQGHSSLQSRNGYKQSFSQSRSEKIRRRASSFNENLGKNKPLQSSQNFNSQLPMNTLQKIDKQSISFQQGEKSSPSSKSPKSIQGFDQSPIQSQKSSQHIIQERSSQHVDQQQLPSKLDPKQKFGDSTKKIQEQKTVEKKLSTPDQNNKKCTPLPTNQHLELTSPKSHDQKYSKEHSQSTNDDIKSNITTSTDSAVAPKPQNSAGQQSSNQSSLNHTNDLRKSIYKEQTTSFTKRLKKVFSLSNIKQDGVTQLSSSTSNSPSPPNVSVAKPKFSSLRVKGKNYINNLNENNKNNNIKQIIKNNNVDKDVSPTKGDIDVEINNNKSGSTNLRRRSFIDIQSLFAKNDRKQNKEHKHQHQPSQQRQFRKSSSDRCPSQKKRTEDKKRSSKDEINPSEDIKDRDKQQNENKTTRERNSMVFFKKASIPSRFSSLPTRNNVRYKHPTIQQLQTQYQPQICHKSDPVNQGSLSEDCVNNQHITQSQLNSLPASQSSETGISSIDASERHNNVSAHISTIKANKPYLNLGTSASRSVPLLVTGGDNDLPPTPSTLKKLQFSSNILVHETWTRDDYDRRGDQSTCNKLTPLLAQRIKQELNEFKLVEMQVHEDSKKNTHFFA